MTDIKKALSSGLKMVYKEQCNTGRRVNGDIRRKAE
jgi:hypothetical protein